MVEKAYPARKTDLPVALGAKPPQSSLLAVRKICALSEVRYIQGYTDRCMPLLLLDVMKPEALP